jgi:DNA helicase HerA-like ATPase
VGTVEQRNEEIIGRVAATKQQGNNSREFYFWINPKARVNPLDLLVVKEDTRRIYAQVLYITSYSDAESFLEVFASTDFGKVNLGESSVERVTYSVAKAQVLGTSDSVRMPVQFNSPVYLADELTIMELLRVGELEDKYRVPVGYIEQSNGVRVPVSMDIRWLTGPDGAHLNVSGKTRLAAKTSYVLFLISAILQRQEDTAVIIFNVKGSDLLQIHEPNRLLSSEENAETNAEYGRLLRELREVWRCMGLEAKPFDREKVF